MTLRALFLAVALASAPIAAAPLAGCTTTATSQAQLTAAQAAFVAEASYNGFAVSAKAALASGALSEAQRLQLKNIDDQAYNALLAVRAGKGGVDALLAAIAQAQPILKK